MLLLSPTKPWLSFGPVGCCTATLWHCLPQQDFFGQLLDKLGYEDLAAAKLVSRSCHGGIRQQLGSLKLLLFLSLPPAAIAALSCFAGLTSLEVRHTQHNAASRDRKQEYEGLAAVLNTLGLRKVDVLQGKLWLPQGTAQRLAS